jgi:hypothetical protein
VYLSIHRRSREYIEQREMKKRKEKYYKFDYIPLAILEQQAATSSNKRAYYLGIADVPHGGASQFSPSQGKGR